MVKWSTKWIQCSHSERFGQTPPNAYTLIREYSVPVQTSSSEHCSRWLVPLGWWSPHISFNHAFNHTISYTHDCPCKHRKNEVIVRLDTKAHVIMTHEPIQKEYTTDQSINIMASKSDHFDTADQNTVYLSEPVGQNIQCSGFNRLSEGW